MYIHYTYKVFVLLFMDFFRALARFPTWEKLHYLWLHKTNLTLWPHCVLDIGITVGGLTPTRRDPSARMVTRKGNLRHRLKYHGRKDCWRKNVHGTIGYAVRYISNTNERTGVERELQWKLDYACGNNNWRDIELAWQEYQEFERRFGPRGSFRL